MNWNSRTSGDKWHDIEINNSEINIYGQENNKKYENLVDIWRYMYSIDWMPGFIPGYAKLSSESKFESLEEALKASKTTKHATGITASYDMDRNMVIVYVQD